MEFLTITAIDIGTYNLDMIDEITKKFSLL
jgi:hypothetical protein